VVVAITLESVAAASVELVLWMSVTCSTLECSAMSCAEMAARDSFIVASMASLRNFQYYKLVVLLQNYAIKS
jgi:hypothetical protein